MKNRDESNTSSLSVWKIGLCIDGKWEPVHAEKLKFQSVKLKKIFYFIKGHSFILTMKIRL